MNLSRRRLFASLGKAAVATPVIAAALPALAEPVKVVAAATPKTTEHIWQLQEVGPTSFSCIAAIGDDLPAYLFRGGK